MASDRIGRDVQAIFRRRRPYSRSGGTYLLGGRVFGVLSCLHPMRAHRRPLRSNNNWVFSCPAEARGPDLAAAGLIEVGGAKPSNTAQCAWALSFPRQRP